MVDDDDVDRLSGHEWFAIRIHKAIYVATMIEGSRVYLHRFIMNPSKGIEVDHRDLNGLNNQRSNLRCCTHQQNLCNQRAKQGMYSAYKGVTFDKNRASQKKPWLAAIKHWGKRKHLGYFATAEEAAAAYDKAAIKTFGEFARPNFQLQAA